MLLGGSQQLSSILLQSKSLLDKFGLRGDNHKGEFNLPLQFVKAFIQLSEDFSNVASTSKGKAPMFSPRRMSPHAPMKKSTQTRMKDKMVMKEPTRMEMTRQAPRKGKKPSRLHANISHTSSTWSLLW